MHWEAKEKLQTRVWLKCSGNIDKTTVNHSRSGTGEVLDSRWWLSYALIQVWANRKTPNSVRYQTPVLNYSAFPPPLASFPLTVIFSLKNLKQNLLRAEQKWGYSLKVPKYQRVGTATCGIRKGTRTVISPSMSRPDQGPSGRWATCVDAVRRVGQWSPVAAWWLRWIKPAT